MLRKFLRASYFDLAILVTRLSAGLLLAFDHGLPKLETFGQKLHSFPDPIGLGPEASLVLAIFAEFVCAILVALGLFTRLASIPVLILFAVIYFIVGAEDPFMKKEIIVLFFSAFLTVFFAGPGKYSLDRFWLKKG